ncbi:MAG: TetR/AcrR family transcriptional regulator [Pseudomonadota bacterium]
MGRPKSFDEERVLDQAMAVFWDRGYEATSIQDLVEATGINRASMYDCFGDKRGFFQAALERYMETVSAQRLARLDGDKPVRHRIRDYFRDIVAFAEGPGRRLGCMVTNSLIELAPRDAELNTRLNAGVRALEDRFDRLIIEGQVSGEIDPAKDSRAIARFLAATVQGMRVISRGAIYDGPALHDIVNTALATLDSPEKAN